MSAPTGSKNKSKKAETRLPPEEDPEFQIAPMIDILLVLLVFFMSISSTDVLQTNEKVRLPVAKDAKDKNKKAGDGQLTVNILWNNIGNSGVIDIDGKTYGAAAELGPIFQAKLAATPEFRVVIRADKDVKYEFLRTVLSAAGGSGVSNVTFSVVDKEEQK
jgi:biopolymer transport protein ExbD